MPCIGGELAVAWLNGPVEPRGLREVLEKLLNGRTIAQAAQELGIAEGTAKHHALAVYAAYGVSSRADLILAATRQGTGTG